ncbi:hypothetical protein JAAARDRAFT_45525 [Jaapia argillacea MUCL 33604]|uniref:Ubiquitin-like protease family profile domain-containing protein n=1 Tax=Jaapia argillacea MUCL 33604 TaxID=933084 RepID=A0A067Q3G6_9AGAM|nr:hypothetical protein JAAARDRAFT_45525 [Jaapia argillacea MUCL 33604]
MTFMTRVLTRRDEKKFVSSEWVGQGKTYVDVPSHVSDELCRRLEIPPNAKRLLPADSLPIAELITFPLPDISTASEAIHLLAAFSHHPPNVSIEAISARSIPPLRVLQHLRASAGQAMLDGMLSIHDQEHDDSFLPFSIISYWLALHPTIQQRDNWARALEWLKGLPVSACPELVEVRRQVVEALSRTGWKDEIAGCGRVGEITHMLGSEFVTDTAIEAMIAVVQARLNRVPELSSSIIITSLQVPNLLATLPSLTHTVTRANPAYDPRRKGLLPELGRQLAKQQHTKLYFVAYNPKFHWAALCVDVHRREIMWGDSLGWLYPELLFVGLDTWLRQHIGGRSFSVFTDLTCAEQNDHYSCGIIAINTLKHNIFGDPLWTPETRDLLRVQEFLDILQHHIVNVEHGLHPSGKGTKDNPSEFPSPPP